MNNKAMTLRENRLLVMPMVLFLLAFLGFPLLADVVYSLSHVTFENLRSPELKGLGNFSDVLADKDFWKATGFSFQFGTVTALVECGVGLFLAVFLSPLLKRRPWLMAVLMMPMMAAPASLALCTVWFCMNSSAPSRSIYGNGLVTARLFLMPIMPFTP